MGELVIRHEIVREVVRIMIDRIAELEAENVRLRGALKPFSELADEHADGYADYDSAFVAVKHLRRARAALAGKEPT